VATRPASEDRRRRRKGLCGSGGRAKERLGSRRAAQSDLPHIRSMLSVPTVVVSFRRRRRITTEDRRTRRRDDSRAPIIWVGPARTKPISGGRFDRPRRPSSCPSPQKRANEADSSRANRRHRIAQTKPIPGGRLRIPRTLAIRCSSWFSSPFSAIEAKSNPTVNLSMKYVMAIHHRDEPEQTNPIPRLVVRARRLRRPNGEQATSRGRNDETN
jgi:hypothetical protein